ncbi:DNA repair protein RAD51 homolog 3 [Tanacetum coccineum]
MEALEILKRVSNGSTLESTSSGHTIVNNMHALFGFLFPTCAQSAWDMLQEEEVLVEFQESGKHNSVNFQIPYDYGGLGGKAIYIDTKGSFMVERALQIAEACSDDMAEYSRMYRKGSHDKQPQDFLEIIFYFRVCTYTK